MILLYCVSKGITLPRSPRRTWRFSPTPGRFTTDSMPSVETNEISFRFKSYVIWNYLHSRNSRGSPTPDNSSSCGVLIDPPHKMTSRMAL